MPPAVPPKRGRAQVSAVSATQSPGGTKTIDFTLGGSHTEDEQAALLESMLADANADQDRREIKDPFENMGTPRDLAQKYGLPHDDDDSDGDDFGPDSEDEEASKTPSPKKNFSWDQQKEFTGLAETNARLAQELEERKVMIKKLGVMLEALEPVPGVDAERLLDALEGDPNSDPRDTKIIQLAKKARNLTVENTRLQAKLDKERLESTAKDREIAELKSQLTALASPEARELMMKQLAGTAQAQAPQPSRDRRREQTADDSHAGSPRSTAGRKKDKELIDARQRLARANEEVKKLKSALHKELGLAEGEPLPAKVLEDGWRGRAEKIVLLRSKVKRLECDLEAVTGHKDPKAAAHAQTHDVDRQARQDLADMEEERRRATEQLTQRYGQLEEDLGQAKQRLDASKARSSVLENENTRFRKQLRVLLGKAEDDDKLVDELRGEVKALRMELRSAKSRMDQSMQESGYGHTRTTVAGTQLIRQQQQFDQAKSRRLEESLKSQVSR